MEAKEWNSRGTNLFSVATEEVNNAYPVRRRIAGSGASCIVEGGVSWEGLPFCGETQ